MASFAFLLQASLNLQKSVSNPLIAKLISTFGRRTIPLFQLMAFAGIDDDGRLSLCQDSTSDCPRATKFHSSAARTNGE